jgi:hypothetical protein
MNKQNKTRYVWSLEGDLQRLKRELNDDLANHQKLVIERTAATIKAPDLPSDEYNKNLEHLENIKKELARIKLNIDQGNMKIILIEKELATCKSEEN